MSVKSSMELIEQINRISAAESSAEGRVAPTRRAWAAANRLLDLLRSSVMQTVFTSFTVFGVTAIQGIILARLLGPEARGEFGTAVFFTYALSTMGLVGTQFAVARRAAREPSCASQLAKSVLRLGGCTGLGTILVVSLLAFTILPEEKQYLAPLCVLCALAQPLEHIRLLLLAVDQGSGAFRRYNIVVLATSVVLPISLIVMWALEMTSMVMAAMLILVPPLVGLVLRLSLRDAHRASITAPSPRPIVLVKEGLPYWLSGAVCDLYTRLDQFLFLWMGSFMAQGQYAAAVPAAGMMLVGADAIALFSFNAGSRNQELTTRRQLLHRGALIAVFQAVVAACFASVVGPLIILFYGNEFVGAVPFALALIPGQAIHGFARVVEGHLRGRGKVGVGIWARLAAAALMIATVQLSFDRFNVLSIPLAASLGNGLVAIILTSFAIAEIGWQPGAAAISKIGEARS
jgi:antigen flippase